MRCWCSHIVEYSILWFKSVTRGGSTQKASRRRETHFFFIQSQFGLGGSLSLSPLPRRPVSLSLGKSDSFVSILRSTRCSLRSNEADQPRNDRAIPPIRIASRRVTSAPHEAKSNAAVDGTIECTMARSTSWISQETGTIAPVPPANTHFC